jgi:hypothetical protein
MHMEGTTPIPGTTPGAGGDSDSDDDDPYRISALGDTNYREGEREGEINTDWQDRDEEKEETAVQGGAVKAPLLAPGIGIGIGGGGRSGGIGSHGHSHCSETTNFLSQYLAGDHTMLAGNRDRGSRGAGGRVGV